MNSLKIITRLPTINQRIWCTLFDRNYSKPIVAKKKKMGKIGPISEKREILVETDVSKLMGYVCGSNVFKTGQDIQIKADSEYPDWLWNIRTGPPPKLEELDPNTKQYWRKLRKMALERNNNISKLRRF